MNWLLHDARFPLLVGLAVSALAAVVLERAFANPSVGGWYLDFPMTFAAGSVLLGVGGIAGVLAEGGESGLADGFIGATSGVIVTTIVLLALRRWQVGKGSTE